MRDRALLVFAASSALVALHTAADAFIWPEQGTAWSDHLLPGLATLAVLAAGVMAFRFCRPGLRAALAVTTGRAFSSHRPGSRSVCSGSSCSGGHASPGGCATSVAPG